MGDDFVVGNMQFYQRNGEWVIKPINNNGVQEIIQSLIDENEKLRSERDAERALADQLYDALCQMVTYSCCPDRHFAPCDCGPDAPQLPEGEENAEAIAAWLEARHG